MEAFIICEETNGSAERVLAKYAIDHARAGGGGGREGGGRRERVSEEAAVEGVKRSGGCRVGADKAEALED